MAFKNCPKCNELLGENANFCFGCKYDYNLKRIRTIEDEKHINDEKQKVLDEKKANIDYEKKLQNQIEIDKNKTIQRNARYEYMTKYIRDTDSGYPDNIQIDKTLSTYASEGWRLHTALSNEIGKNTSSAGFGGLSSGTNVTINTTILIFERCIKKDEN